MKERTEINKKKVIIIGMQRTGTTSLGEALLILGYSVLGTPIGLSESLLNNDFNPALEMAKPFDALQDLPWLFLFKELDEKYPGSKFILTNREENKWIQSMLDHFSNSNTSMRKWAYGEGTPKGNETLYMDKYRMHYAEARNYFKNRSEDLLEMDLASGDKWSILCEFLNVPIPNRNFPHSNKSIQNYSLKEKGYRILRNLVPIRFRIFILNLIGKKNKRNRFRN